ncbi:MAG TPA: hypothetical protein VF818_02510 [Ktedonobacterales bacterium]
MISKRSRRSGDLATDQQLHYPFTRYGWSWTEIRATFLETLGPLLLGAVGLCIIYGLIKAVVTGHVTALWFGQMLLAWAVVAVAGTVLVTLLFVVTGMWTTSLRHRRSKGGKQALHDPEDDQAHRRPTH